MQQNEQSRFQPSPERVAVRRVESKKQTAGGIFIPEAAQEKQTVAVVVAVGEKVEHLRVEDRVIFGKYTGTEITVGEQALVVMDAKDVLGVVR